MTPVFRLVGAAGASILAAMPGTHTTPRALSAPCPPQPIQSLPSS